MRHRGGDDCNDKRDGPQHAEDAPRLPSAAKVCSRFGYELFDLCHGILLLESTSFQLLIVLGVVLSVAVAGGCTGTVRVPNASIGHTSSGSVRPFAARYAVSLLSLRSSIQPDDGTEYFAPAYENVAPGVPTNRYDTVPVWQV